MKCKSCGKQIESDFKLCPYCGADVASMKEEPAEEPIIEPQQEESNTVLGGVAPVPDPQPYDEEDVNPFEEDLSEEDEDDEEVEYYEIPLKKIIMIVAALVIVIGGGIFAYLTFFSNPLQATAETIEAGSTVDPMTLVELKSNAADKYTYEVTDNAIDTSTLGEYTVTYSLTKTSNSKTKAVDFPFEVVDTTAPVINVDDTITVMRGTDFTISEYAMVVDALDGILSADAVTVDGGVDTSVEGTYAITINATDAEGNVASKDINVIVVGAMGDPAEFLDKVSGSWHNVDSNIVINFSTDSVLSIGYYLSEGFGEGTLEFISVNEELTQATMHWNFRNFEFNEDGDIIYSDAQVMTVTVDTGVPRDNLITVDLGFGEGEQEFKYLK